MRNYDVFFCRQNFVIACHHLPDTQKKFVFLSFTHFDLGKLHLHKGYWQFILCFKLLDEAKSAKKMSPLMSDKGSPCMCYVYVRLSLILCLRCR